MNKYKVKVSHLFSEVFDIEAENENEAREKARVELEKDSHEVKPQYETTLPLEHWPVITEEQFNKLVKDFQSELAKQEEGNKESSNIITPNIITP